MILLYPSTETEFQNNGLGALPDAISCTVTEERNGMYELEMQYPVSGSHYGGDREPGNSFLQARPVPGSSAVPHIPHSETDFRACDRIRPAYQL